MFLDSVETFENLQITNRRRIIISRQFFKLALFLPPCDKNFLPLMSPVIFDYRTYRNNVKYRHVKCINIRMVEKRW